MVADAGVGVADGFYKCFSGSGDAVLLQMVQKTLLADTAAIDIGVVHHRVFHGDVNDLQSLLRLQKAAVNHPAFLLIHDPAAVYRNGVADTWDSLDLLRDAFQGAAGSGDNVNAPLNALVQCPPVFLRKAFVVI